MILEHLQSPADLKRLPLQELPALCTEIRRKILETVTKNGGHLGSSMGVVELTVALHRVYDFPHDRLFLDTGHQGYPHKLLTGRFDRFHTLRQKNGISGFPNKDESPYDLMTSGHAGTAISMALGACIGDALAPQPERGRRRSVAVVGDASIVSGISLEALNSAGHLDRDLLIILNDNEQSIGKTVGALSRVLSKVRLSRLYTGAMRAAEKIENLVARIPKIGERVEKSVHALADHLKHVIVPGQVLDALGFRYFGIFDGHDLDGMVAVLQAMRAQPGMKLLHVLTVKGKGVKGCEEDPLALHGAKPGDSFVLEGDAACKVDKVVVATAGAVGKKGPARIEFARCFAETMVQEGERDPAVCAITAGMPDGTGLRPFSEKFPDRFFNVGIAEQHGLAFASGLTIGGRKPVCAIYSTFMQRGYDQVFQEIALQRNPVVLVMSHGGLAGDDGATHHGLFDIAFLRAIPGIVLMSPRDGGELQEMLRFALKHPGPIAMRYPKAQTLAPGRVVAPVELGRAELLREGDDVALVGYGQMAEVALEAAELLEAQGCSCTVVNARFARPLDHALFDKLLTSHRLVVTVEEATLNGGFGSALLEHAAQVDRAHARILPLGVPDRFIEHGSRAELLQELGLTPAGIRDTVLGHTREAAFHGSAAR
jgi:1-deoxy-D-xylulose-5-phosphate synthase